MKPTAVINIVAFSQSLIGEHTPNIKRYIDERAQLSTVEPAFPAVTCTAQTNYLTGKTATDHGIVANGWYFREECEVKLWRQSNKLVQAPKLWDAARDRDAEFSVANMFWWYNMYSSVDYSVTPRPQYLADGRKMPDCYSHPASLRDELQQELGTFPLFSFWGPNTSVKSSQWIADASKIVYQKHQPTLTLIYLPHLDYGLQKYDHDDPRVLKDLAEIDQVIGDLIDFYDKNGVQTILLSGYGITPVSKTIYLNRTLRKAGLINVRVERGLELLDAGASSAFAMADHQIAHVYVNDKNRLAEVRKLLEQEPGIETILDETGKKEWGIDHDRAGDFVVVADSNSWFSYYYWLDDKKAPDFARKVDIHRKPGYDPAEMFLDPKKKFIYPRIALKVLKKKLGFRMNMNVIPLDATLVKGTHGRKNVPDRYKPVYISPNQSSTNLESTEVHDFILKEVFGD
ncbi:MAG: nucleotide pyrophosphatase/phosphodiesterase family protein [Bacteroidota bacterium]